MRDKKGISVAQAAIAWVLARGENVVALVGARRRQSLQEALGALEVSLTDEDLAGIEAAIPAEMVAGQRYLPDQMAILDSERP